MSNMSAIHARGKELQDAIFGASAACKEAIQQYGSDKVTNATIGTMVDDTGKLAVLPTVERVFRSLAIEDYMGYAPITGLPAYLKAVQSLVFADNRPAGYTAATASAGGTGALRLAISNYVELGDAVLTSDWFWGTYNVLCCEQGCRLETFTLFDEKLQFNLKAFTTKVDTLLKVQQSLLIIINTPAHNPTGFSLSNEDWDNVLSVVKEHAKLGKRLIVLTDIAYIDFAGEKNETRKFMQKFGNLSDNILSLFAFSMSKGFTAYGQRTGALVAVSSNKEVIEEFKAITKYTARASWSNINKGAMTLLTRIEADKTTLAQFEKERNDFYQIIKKRADIFMTEAKECGLNALPYKGGFFLSVPSIDANKVCESLHNAFIYAVPLKLGVRIAACSVPADKMKGIAAKIQRIL